MIKLHPLLLSLLILISPSLSAKSDNHMLEDITIFSLTKEKLNIMDYREGKPLYLKFWATWCVPCLEQMPHLQQAYEKYGDNVKFLAVNVDVNDSVEAIKAVIERNSLTVPMAVDESGMLTNAVGLVGTPLSVLFNAQGEIVFKGHEASTLLDVALLKLSKGENMSSLMEPVQKQKNSNVLLLNKNKLNILLFTATWCDDYLKESRPNISKNCINAPRITNQLYNDFPEENWLGVISRLWTGNKEVEQFKKRYGIKYSLMLDETNEVYNEYKVKNFPTFILLKNGQEVFRSIGLIELDRMKSEISRYSTKNNIEDINE